jgi:hypothetical protein
MPDAASRPSGHGRPHLALRLAAVAAVLALLTACGGGSPATPEASTDGSPLPSASPAPDTAQPAPTIGDGTSLCEQIGAVGSRIAALRAVELRLPNRVALDIELGKLQAAFTELSQADLGPFADRLEVPLTRLGYRLAEVELAVEDFRTNSRPQRAVTHVQSDAQTFSDELASFAILARC